MKKIILILFMSLLVVSLVSAKSWAIGVQGGAGGLGNTAVAGGMVVFRMPDFPVMFGVGASGNSFAVTADWWLHHQHLVGIIDLYAGAGLGFAADSGFDAISLSGRVPVGFRIWPLGSSLLELYLELVPGIGFTISGGDTGLQIPAWNAALGLRFWF